MAARISAFSRRVACGSYGGGGRGSHGELEILHALDSDRAELAAHDRMCLFSRPECVCTQGPGGGARGIVGWRGAVAGRRVGWLGVGSLGAGRRGAARRALQGRSSRAYGL